MLKTLGVGVGQELVSLSKCLLIPETVPICREQTHSIDSGMEERGRGEWQMVGGLSPTLPPGPPAEACRGCGCGSPSPGATPCTALQHLWRGRAPGGVASVDRRAEEGEAGPSHGSSVCLGLGSGNLSRAQADSP